ncbi:hypothetical protein [Pseudonocardia phyllosphaerae]|uniref:hypothetical protein n=1 Tax=Pseudonocardia phyllosphaerae TaxID=3390502 RepID=UPI00397BB622
MAVGWRGRRRPAPVPDAGGERWGVARLVAERRAEQDGTDPGSPEGRTPVDGPAARSAPVGRARQAAGADRDPVPAPRSGGSGEPGDAPARPPESASASASASAGPEATPVRTPPVRTPPPPHDPGPVRDAEPANAGRVVASGRPVRRAVPVQRRPGPVTATDPAASSEANPPAAETATEADPAAAEPASGAAPRAAGSATGSGSAAEPAAEHRRRAPDRPARPGGDAAYRVPALPARPPVDLEPGLVGFSRLTRGRTGARVFALCFVLIYLVIVVQTLISIF